VINSANNLMLTNLFIGSKPSTCTQATVMADCYIVDFMILMETKELDLFNEDLFSEPQNLFAHMGVRANTQTHNFCQINLSKLGVCPQLAKISIGYDFVRVLLRAPGAYKFIDSTSCLHNYLDSSVQPPNLTYLDSQLTKLRILE